MPGHPRLYRRGATFYHRAAIPTDIKGTYPKAEETFSLRTKDYREAVRRVRVEAARVDRLFDAHRRDLERQAEPAVAELTDAQIKHIGEIYYAHLLDEDEELRLEGFEGRSFEEYSDDTDALDSVSRQSYAQGKQDAFFRAEAAEVLTWSNVDIKLAPESPSWRKLVRELQAVTIRANEAIRQRNKGEVIETPIVASNVEPPSPSTPLLSVAISKWVEEKSRTRWVQKTADAHRIWADRFVAVAGDRPLEAYGKADAREFKEILMALPANWSQHPKLDGKNISDAAAIARKLDLAPMAVSNTNKILGFVAAFWNWAKANYDEVTTNPFDGMKLKKSAKARDERHPFTPEELRIIFHAPLYTGCQSLKAWRTPGDFVPRDSGLYWVPLIALFTGARSGEIIQLYASDVAEEDGILRFQLTDNGDDQRVKTASSRRLTPIHPTLQDLGLMDLVEKRRKGSVQRLFPDLKPGSDGYYSSAYSRKFRHFLEKLGIKHEKNAFHSFRHCFEDACRDSRIPWDIMNALQGHSDSGMSQRYGGRGNEERDERYTLDRLDEEMRKLRYRHLDLSHLKQPRTAFE